MLDKFFGIKENGSSMRIEILAGITTFFATAYIILVNPMVLSQGDQQIFRGVFIATCIGSAIGTFLMAFYAKIPFTQAPGMGLNAFFAYTAMPAIAAFLVAEKLTTQQQFHMALPLVFYAGVLFIIVSAIGWREKIINGIPNNIKLALTGGIGLFIAHLGLQNSKIVVGHPATKITLLNFADRSPENSHLIHGAILTFIGLVIIAALASKKVKGSVLIGILLTTVISFITGYSKMPGDFSFDISPHVSDFFNVCLLKLDFFGPFSHGHLGQAIGTMLALTLAFAMVNMFDSMATIYGVAQSAGMVEPNGEIRGIRKGLMADAMGTTIGALAGTSTVTTVVESATGIGEGGRTGMTSVISGLLFLGALVCAPIVGLIPAVATAPALIYVGCLMMGSVKAVDFSEPTDGIPAFLTIVMMPLTYSIANGIAFGLIAYVCCKLLTGRAKEIKLPTYIVAALFILQFVLR